MDPFVSLSPHLPRLRSASDAVLATMKAPEAEGVATMLSTDTVKNNVCDVVRDYPTVRRVDLFGSYAQRTQRESSDVDLLVEFSTPAVSLLTLSALRRRIESALAVPVDLLHAPLPEDSILDIGKVVTLYEK